MPGNLLNDLQTYTVGVQPVSEMSGLAVTPNDGVDLPAGPCAGVRVAVGGNVSINLPGGGTAVLTGLAAGQRVRVNASRILATGTTATGIQALYNTGDR